MPARKPVTDEEKALTLNYPARPKGDRQRAVVYWKREACDLGVFGSAESFHTLLELRQHLAAGNSPPRMAELRRSVMAEKSSETSGLIEERDELLSTQADLMCQLEQLEARASEMESLEASLSQSLERRDDAIRKQSVLVKSRRVERAAVAAVGLIFAASLCWHAARSMVLTPKEREVVQAMRDQRLDTLASHREKHAAGSDAVRKLMSKDGAKEWLDEKLGEQLARHSQ